jgi:hypothetical protein
MYRRMELKTKEFPDNYPSDAVAILDAMSFSDGAELRLVGSNSLRSQQYAGDYDAYEVVECDGESVESALDSLAKRFQSIVRRLHSMSNVYIGDIKAGAIPEWEVVPSVKSYSGPRSRKIVERLYADGIITKQESDSARSLLKDRMAKNKIVYAKGSLKFHVVRWSVPEVLRGSKTLRDGSTFTLQEAFSSHGLSKLDVIGLVANNRYTDFSIIYEFHYKGKTLNPVPINIKESLMESIIEYTVEGNPFKVLKRRFALAKYENKMSEIQRLTPILNSDLGRLYLLATDLGTVVSLLETHKDAPLKHIKFELDQFRGRMANIYTVKDFIRIEPELLRAIKTAMRAKTAKKLLPTLVYLKEKLDDVLKKNTKIA